MILDDFEKLSLGRRATRHFRQDPIEKELLDRVLDIAHWAPSGYNLQPTHFLVVTDEKLKLALHSICMEQSQILEAPTIVIFAGDRRVAENNFEKAIKMDLDEKAITEEYATRMRGFVDLSFKQGPLGINWLWKALLIPFVRLFRPIPTIPAVYKGNWVDKQVMLVAMNFMLAASAAGLATVPMEGFDEGKLKRLLKIPSSFTVPIIIPVGYSASKDLKKTRLPLKDIIHKNTW
jgi:nitroreductase